MTEISGWSGGHGQFLLRFFVGWLGDAACVLLGERGFHLARASEIDSTWRGHLRSSGAMSPDPIERTEEEPAHDVLAAEAFAVPAPDAELRHRPVELPEDPSGIAEPHDILAAEAFAMPAGRPGAVSSGRRPGDAVRWAALAAAAVLGLLALLRRRRRR